MDTHRLHGTLSMFASFTNSSHALFCCASLARRRHCTSPATWAGGVKKKKVRSPPTGLDFGNSKVTASCHGSKSRPPCWKVCGVRHVVYNRLVPRELGQECSFLRTCCPITDSFCLLCNVDDTKGICDVILYYSPVIFCMTMEVMVRCDAL